MFHRLRLLPIAFGALLAACSSSPPPPGPSASPSGHTRDGCHRGAGAARHRQGPRRPQRRQFSAIRPEQHRGARDPFRPPGPSLSRCSSVCRATTPLRAASAIPVLFITDVNYAFPLVRSIGANGRRQGRGARRLPARRPGLRRRRQSRRIPAAATTRRRATVRATPCPTNPAGRRCTARPRPTGASSPRKCFRSSRANYRADSARRIFAGHSYGALFGAHVLLTEPAMFERYVLSSPSLWFDQRVMFERERRYAATHADLPAKVFLSIGSYETVAPKSRRPALQPDPGHDRGPACVRGATQGAALSRPADRVDRRTRRRPPERLSGSHHAPGCAGRCPRRADAATSNHKAEPARVYVHASRPALTTVRAVLIRSASKLR